MRDRFVIDSNILICALNRDAGEKHRKAKNFINISKSKSAAIPTQCLAETYYQILKKKADTEEATKTIKSLKNSRYFEILDYTSEELEKSLGKEKNFWDRLIQETALENGYEVIYSENTDDFKKLEAVNPFRTWQEIAEEGVELGKEFDREEANERGKN